MSDKTEQPTARRLRKALEEGDSPISAALTQALGFMVALALVPAALAATAGRMAALVRSQIENADSHLPAWFLVREVVLLSAPLLAAVASVALAAGLVQTGGAIAMKKLTPELVRLNPLSGLKNVLSWQRMLAVLRASAAATIVCWLAVRLLVDHAADLTNSAGNASAAATAAGVLAQRLGWIAALVGLALAGLDVLLTRWSWLQRNRMTKDEVKRELREAEGDPEIKAARRRAHQELLRGATLAAVKDATVVIVNPTHLATALRYLEGEDEAPRVIAQGEGELARQILEAARAYGVPVVHDVPVARALSELEIGDEIPEALYEAVAEILRELWRAQEAAEHGSREADE